MRVLPQITPGLAQSEANARSPVEISAPKPVSSDPPAPAKKKVVVIGGGFGGLEAARVLGNKAGVEVTLIDKNRDFVFQPLLFQVATGKLTTEDISSPIDQHLAEYDNAKFVQAAVKDVDEAGGRVLLADGKSVEFDYLIVAAGVKKSYFGKNDWERSTVGFKTAEDAVEIKDRVVSAFAAAAKETDQERKKALLTFVVVGGGPSGVELAGELSSAVKKLAKKHRSIDRSEVSILLVEGGPRILPRLSEDQAKYAEKTLEDHGVGVLTSRHVTQVDTERVTLDDRAIATHNVFWAAGTEGTPIAKALDAPLDPAGRVIVKEDLTIPEHSNIFVVGDLAAAKSEGQLVPGVAQGAIQGAHFAAQAILDDLEEKPRSSFKYVSKGDMAYVTRGHAVARLPFANLSGKAAWGAWLAVHVGFLPESLSTRASVLGTNIFGTAKHLK
jgi:NADH:ubiquinone reductase (H+-translocating)